MKTLLLFSLALLPCGLALAQNAPIQTPSLSPDGKRLAFVRKTASGTRLYVGSWNGKTVSNARSLGGGADGNDIQPAWRPDGKLIAFASSRGAAKRTDLFSIHPDGSNLKRLTNTPQMDETQPQFSANQFTLRKGPADPLVPDRSAKSLTSSELQLIQKLTGNADALDKYASNFEGESFGANVGVRFYKIIARQNSGANEGKLFVMRDDGSQRRVAEVGMTGDYSSPRVAADGTLVFVRATGGKNLLYRARFPIVSELYDDKGNPKPMAVDVGEWRRSFQKIGEINKGSQLAFSPSGEQIAVASGASVRVLMRNDTEVSRGALPFVAPNKSKDLFWARDGRTLWLANSNGTLAPVSNPNPLADVHNLLAFSDGPDRGDGLNALDRPLLARNSFVVGGRGNRQMFAQYEETDYQDLPVFVSSDVLLHLNHLVFDSLLRETETKNLLPVTIDLTKRYLQLSIQQSRNNDDLQSDALANAAYWAVVARLLRGEVSTGLGAPPSTATADDAAQMNANRAKNIAAMNAKTASLAPLLKALPPAAKKLADEEIALIKAHEGRSPSPIFGGALTGVGQPDEELADTRIDYSQFAPRGHYTRTEALRRYFLAQRWLSGAPFHATPAHLRRALLMANQTDMATQQKLQTANTVMAQFVGESDDRRFLDVAAIARRVYGADIPLGAVGDNAKMATFQSEVDKLPRPKIAPSGGPAMTIFPSPYTLDAEAMQNLVYDRNPPDVGTEEVPRYFALGLDAMAVLGSDRARNLLDTFTFGGSFFDFGVKESGYENYDKQYRIERAKLDNLPPTEWKKSFYSQTLWSLKPLLKPQAQPQYKFTQNDAWKDKQLVAALGAWAELKHDTLPKQPVAIEAGGEGGLTEVVLRQQPQGVIEPSPELFKRLRELAASERAALAKAGYLSKESGERLDAMTSLLDMVIRLEAKQRAGQAFTRGEVEQLRFFGTFIEHITLISLEGQAQTMEDNDMALIADVSSALSTRGGGLRVLEEGVGRALPIYVAFERDGRRQLACGATYSYYEFTQLASERLSDAAWQELLATPQAPKMPAWTKSFVSHVGD